MKLKTPSNRNYCAVVTTINNHIPLAGRDKIVHAVIFGNKVIIGKNYPVGTVGVYFPAETQLSDKFCYENNLYSEPEWNKDKTKGYISHKNRRIRAIQLGGYESNGLFLSLDCLKFTGDISELKVGDEFDELNGIELCKKYIPYKELREASVSNKKSKAKVKVFNRLVDNQFHLHCDTSHLGKNVHKLDLKDLISITEKLHGTSGVSANVLVKKKLTWIEKVLLKLGLNIETMHYDTEGIYSSRKVVKNAKEKNYTGNGYYGESNDIWKEADKVIRPVLQKGESVYYEIVGYLPAGGYIQKGYDYGCIKPVDRFEYGKNFMIYIYRVTTTNVDGQVHELSAKQVQQWCEANGLKPVPELFYGTIEQYLNGYSLVDWQEKFLQFLSADFWHNNCKMCNNNVPNEGIVVRKEILGIDPYKYKSFQFLKYETACLDEGEVDIEEQSSDLVE